MKHSTCTLCFAIMLVALTACGALAQNPGVAQPDSLAVRQAALDYIEGLYSSDVARLEKAIHPDINKATPRDLPQTGRTILTYSTYSGLVEQTRGRIGALADTARHIQIRVLNIDNDVANVKVASANYTELVQMIKLDGQWKIVNAVSAPGTGAAPRLRDFKPENERSAIERTAMDYLAGLTGADAARLEITVSPEFSKITLNPVAATGKTGLRRQRYQSIVENTLARIGKQDEVYRDNRVAIVDVVDGLALVRCDETGVYEFVQMFKGDGRWKILNSVSKQNASLTLEQALTVTVGNPMPDFTLPVYGGKEFGLSRFRGKNVMLLFPRGWVGGAWCSYCPYQYLELEQLEKATGIRSKYNLEIAFVLPYSAERVKDWMEKFPDALRVVENIKNPTPAPPAGSIQSDYAAWARKFYPKVFDVKKDDSHATIPVLVDEHRTLSRQLKIFTGFWDGVSSEQNVATALIIDKNGILKFKYIGQMTEDRPSVDFLLDLVKQMK
jgi:peroxiredoxin